MTHRTNPPDSWLTDDSFLDDPVEPTEDELMDEELIKADTKDLNEYYRYERIGGLDGYE